MKIVKELDKVSAKWKDCEKCPIGMVADNHVFYDYSDYNLEVKEKVQTIVMVGEAPGEVEDRIGYPFVGPSGTLLRSMIDDVMSHENAPTYVFFVNVISCRPTNNRIPTFIERSNCSPRLKRTLKIFKEETEICKFVAVGSYPKEILEKHYKWTKAEHIYHPSYILRNGGKSSSMYEGWAKGFRRIVTK